MLNQLIASAIAIGLGMIASLIILKVVDLTIGVRVSTEDEIAGLDLSQHGEEGYNIDADLGVAGVFGHGGASVGDPVFSAAKALEQ